MIFTSKSLFAFITQPVGVTGFGVAVGLAVGLGVAVGFTVGLAGFLTVHPLFGFKLPAVLRGFAMGIFATLTLALGILINGATPEAITAFWMTLIAGGIIGLIIDVILTKIAGEGADLK